MKILNKLINWIKSICKKNSQKLLNVGQKENLLEIIQEENDCKTEENIFENINLEYYKSIRDKEEFFRMYNEYKAGRIKEEDLLIEDLIDLQIMLVNESNIMKENIDLAEINIREQEKQIDRMKISAN